MDLLGRRIPRGLGKGGVWTLDGDHQLLEIMRRGATFAVEQGHGTPRDLERCEDHGHVGDADPGQVSERARERGRHQVGSLGSGNHFLEVQVVAEVLDPETARRYDLHPGQVCVMIHCGSRGLGHQICSDHVRTMVQAMPGAGITVPDQQLACARVDSAPGRRYLGAMNAAANYGRANRQLLTEATRRAFAEITGTDRLDLLYDVSHNLAKLEEHDVNGRTRLLCVHRKGATRALPPGHADLPADLVDVGQPVLIPGSMGTASHVLAGVPDGPAFHSTAHGAGRVMSRHAARKKIRGQQLRAELQAAGIEVRAGSWRGLAEEAPFSYKDVDEVVLTCERAGLARRVARLTPLGVIKG
jgi:tRNA-splicing ligase RtcB